MHSIFSRNCFSFHKILTETFLAKNEFSKIFQQFLKFSAFSMAKSIAGHLKKNQAMCIVVCFDASFDYERSFLKDFLPKNIKKEGSLDLCQLFKKDFVRLRKQLKETGLRDAHWIARWDSRPHFRVRLIVDRWSSQGTLKM